MTKEKCSGCLREDITVNREKFDGMCADCTERALYDEDFAEKAHNRNERWLNHQEASNEIF